KYRIFGKNSIELPIQKTAKAYFPDFFIFLHTVLLFPIIFLCLSGDKKTGCEMFEGICARLKIVKVWL
ncbi:MAG: hypothetical protein ACOCUT_03660, partial [bacterium]